MEQHKFSPETLMMSYGYKPELSEGALKCPIFQTSTFVFNTAEEGKAFFEIAYGLRDKKPSEELGLIYSRLNNPDLEILENRLCLWDGAQECAVFESGMSAISTIMLEFLKPGDLLFFSTPVYGGTDHLIRHVLPKFKIDVLCFPAGIPTEEIMEILVKSGKSAKLAMIFMETPANPTNALIDISGCKEIALKISENKRVIPVVVDNTYMGPLWSHPLKHGADIVVYSATKFIGGHSDTIAGACLGSKELISRVRSLRTFLGNMAGPWTGWLLMRSLETLKIRMEAQAKGAEAVAQYLNGHPRVEKVYYLGFLSPESDKQQYEVLKKQYTSFGSMIAFTIKGGEKEAFAFLNKLKIFKLAVSLGGTESLAQHPYTMTHSDMCEEDKETIGITENLIRLSIGVENPDDLVWAIKTGLE
jgi:methionine-gamma-lyase